MNKDTEYIKKEQCKNDWYHIDAENETLGRIATRIALMLQGKNKPTYTPNVDNGDFVVVTNAEKVHVSGNKPDKMYYNFYTGFISGHKQPSFKEMIEKHPHKVLELAVQRMLPRGILGRKFLTKLKIYSGADHPHSAQSPKTIKVTR